MQKQDFFKAFYEALNIRGFRIDHDLFYYLIQIADTDDCRCLVLPWLEQLDRTYDVDKFQDILDITDTWETAWLFVMQYGAKYIGKNKFLITVSKLYS